MVMTVRVASNGRLAPSSDIPYTASTNSTIHRRSQEISDNDDESSARRPRYAHIKDLQAKANAAYNIGLQTPVSRGYNHLLISNDLLTEYCIS